MVKAALQLFSERGLDTPLTAIAKEAGVAVQTLYFTFHTKSALLMAAYDYAVLGEGRTSPLDDPAGERMRRTRDPRAVIEAIVEVNADILPRIGPLLGQMQSAIADPEIIAFVADREKLRVEGYGRLVDELMSRSPLRRGVAREKARDIMLAITIPQLSLVLIRSRGWSMDEWRNWAVQTLSDQLLPARRAPAR
jgi:AcrR family transcriptional regulator